MKNDTVIKLENISKLYKLYSSPQDRLIEALHPFRKKFHKDFYALQNINLELYKGDSLGIVGSNGAGKSTLLKIISGVLTPTTGNLEVNGKISALIELGTGFNPEFTGIENVYFKSSLLGFTRSEVDKVIDSIIEFADIGDYIHQPVKTYSSGMFVRLAFAVAVNLKPDILILDEIMSVGDIRFAQKAIRKMKQLVQNSKALIYVTHDTQSIINYCNKAIWIKNGIIEAAGEPKEVVEKYTIYSLDRDYYEKENSKISDETAQKAFNDDVVFEKITAQEQILKKKAEITGYALYKNNPRKKLMFANYNDKIELYLKFIIKKRLEKPILGFTLKNEKGEPIFADNDYDFNNDTKPISPGTYITKFEFDMPNLRSGRYLIDIAIVNGVITEYTQEHYIFDAIVLHMVNDSKRQFAQLVEEAKINTYRIDE